MPPLELFETSFANELRDLHQLLISLRKRLINVGEHRTTELIENAYGLDEDSGFTTKIIVGLQARAHKLYIEVFRIDDYFVQLEFRSSRPVILTIARAIVAHVDADINVDELVLPFKGF